MYAFWELVYASRLGMPAEAHAVKHLADAWIKWLRADGKVPIDKILGLAGHRGNRAPAGKAQAIAWRDYVYCELMAKLVRVGFTVDEAAYAVAEKEKNNSSVVSRWKLKALSAKSAGAIFARDMGKKRAVAEGPKLSDQERAALLKKFPLHVLPARYTGKDK